MKLHSDSLLGPRMADIECDIDEETLIEDCRGSTRPVELMEQKLVASMRSGSLNLSHLQTYSRPHDR